MNAGWERSEAFGERFRSIVGRAVEVHGRRASIARAMTAKLGGHYRSWEQRLIRAEKGIIPPRPQLVLWLSAMGLDGAEELAGSFAPCSRGSTP